MEEDGIHLSGGDLARDIDRRLRRALFFSGLMEIGLFGLPLIGAGRWIGRFVRCYDPHIYKEYGVARVVMGILFLLGARRREARTAVATVGALFYALNFFTSIADIVSGNVARLEYAVAVLSAGLAAWLGSLSAAYRRLAPARIARPGAGATVRGSRRPSMRYGLRERPQGRGRICPESTR